MDAKTDLMEKGAILQRDNETYAIVPHIPGGIIFDPNVLRKIADVAEKYGAKVLKLTTAQRMAIVGIKEKDIDNIWTELGMDPAAAAGLCVRSVKFCPATHFCRLAKQDAVTLGMELDKRYHGMQLPSKFKMSISGCMNCCTEPATKDLGIMGTPSGYTIFVGGNGGSKAKVATVLKQNVAPGDVVPIVEKVMTYYKENAEKFERLGKMIERLGFEKFQKDIL